jgi:hypothetical protein
LFFLFSNLNENYEFFKRMLRHPKVVALGEVGLDFKSKDAYTKTQISAFRRFVHWAKKYNMPLCLHVRQATVEAAQVMVEVGFILNFVLDHFCVYKLPFNVGGFTSRLAHPHALLHGQLGHLPGVDEELVKHEVWLHPQRVRRGSREEDPPRPPSARDRLAVLYAEKYGMLFSLYGLFYII